MDVSSAIIQQELTILGQEIIAKHDELGMRASGEFAKSIEQETTMQAGRYIGKVSGLDYAQYLVSGRPPSGKMPPVEAIKQWIEHKGIKPLKENTSVSSLAWAIAKKIAKDGTKYFQHGGTDLIESVVTPQRIQTIIDKVRILEVNFFINTLKNQLKNAN